MFLVLQLGVDGHDDMADENLGHRVLGLSKSTLSTCLEPTLGTAQGQRLKCLVESTVSRSLRATHISNMLCAQPRRCCDCTLRYTSHECTCFVLTDV
jgi:hypothetical protein